jgi:hypothetical protein
VVIFADAAAEGCAPPEAASNGHAASKVWFDDGELTALAHVADTAEVPADSEIVDRIAERIGDVAVQRARDLALELVEREHMLGRLEHVAGELLRRNHLSGDDIEEILQRANP